MAPKSLDIWYSFLVTNHLYFTIMNTLLVLGGIIVGALAGRTFGRQKGHKESHIVVDKRDITRLVENEDFAQAKYILMTREQYFFLDAEGDLMYEDE